MKQSTISAVTWASESTPGRVGMLAGKSLMPSRRRPKPTLVLLVRHGLTPTTGKLLPGRAPGLHLSDDGRAQAHAVAERLAVLPKIEAVYASPLERTRETAGPIAKSHKLRVRTDRGLLEVDIGEWTGWELKRAAKTDAWKTVQG